MNCITLTDFRTSLSACFLAGGETLLNRVDALATETAAHSRRSFREKGAAFIKDYRPHALTVRHCGDCLRLLPRPPQRATIRWAAE